MKNNINLNISRRDFIKTAGAIGGIFLFPSIALSSEDIVYLSNLPGLPDQLTKKIYYSAHIKNYGWTEWHTEGNICGSPEQQRAIEAMAIKVKEGTISYKAYLQGVSWTDWYGNGDICGFVNGEEPYEAFKISVTRGKILYRGHFFENGWTQWLNGGKTCGSPGKFLTLNAIEIMYD